MPPCSRPPAFAGAGSDKPCGRAPKGRPSLPRPSPGAAARAGLHCAPLAHRVLGSFPAGLLRLSFGSLNDGADVARATEALERVAAAARRDRSAAP